MTDERTESLIIKAQEGDSLAFEDLIISHEKIVYNIAFRMLGNSEDVKDISQEVFIKVYRNLKNFNFESAFSTWIYRIAVNTCIDELRKRKGKEAISINDEDEEGKLKTILPDLNDTPEEAFLVRELGEELAGAIEKLSMDHKTMIMLRDLEGFSYTEISEITGVYLGTVKSRIARARGRLKDILLVSTEHRADSYRQNL